MPPQLMTATALVALLAATLSTSAADDTERHAMLTPVPFTDVHIDDAFWSPRFQTKLCSFPNCVTASPPMRSRKRAWMAS
jgi:hypothetical protein